MADESEPRTDSSPSTPDDVPGELLGDDHLVDPGAYEIADDETEAEELDPVAEGEDVDAIEDPAQLAEATAVARRARSTRPVRKAKSAVETVEGEDKEPGATVKTVEKPKPARPTKKAVPTPKQKGASAHRRTSPVQFVRESVGELRKVVWPTGAQLRQYFVVVLVFILLVIAYVGVLDFGFGWGLLKILG